MVCYTCISGRFSLFWGRGPYVSCKPSVRSGELCPIHPSYLCHTLRNFCGASCHGPNALCEIHCGNLRKAAESMTELGALDMAHESRSMLLRFLGPTTSFPVGRNAASHHCSPQKLANVFGDRGRELLRAILRTSLSWPQWQGRRLSSNRNTTAVQLPVTSVKRTLTSFWSVHTCQYDKTADHAEAWWLQNSGPTSCECWIRPCWCEVELLEFWFAKPMTFLSL